jgi:transposase
MSRVAHYCYGIRSERRLCEEISLNLAYRWFCRLGLEAGLARDPELTALTYVSGRAKSNKGPSRRAFFVFWARKHMRFAIRCECRGY